MKNITLIILSALSIIACKEETKTETPIAVQSEIKELSEAQILAHKNGIAAWDDVKKIDFTFNVDRGGQNVAKRSWSWKPKSDAVKMMTAQDTLTYKRSAMDSVTIKADQGFINDKYWLLAPYQIVWDEGTAISYEKGVESPLSRKRSNKLTLLYEGDGGYTPGDAYDFYYGDDYIITEWVFRKGNAAEPSMTNTFEGYKNFEGLNISTDHKNEDGSFRLYFTDIKVTK